MNKFKNFKSTDYNGIRQAILRAITNLVKSFFDKNSIYRVFITPMISFVVKNDYYYWLVLTNGAISDLFLKQ